MNEILSSVRSSEILEQSTCDEHDKRIIEKFVNETCGCHLWNSDSCSKQFTSQHIEETRFNCADLSHNELDMVVLGSLLANSNSTEQVDSSSRHSLTPRKKNYSKFSHLGYPVCPITFRFLHGIGETRLKNLVKHLKLNGLTPRVHKNTRRLPKHSLSLDSIQYVVKLLLNYTDQNGILLPGRIPGYRKTDIKLLPSSVSKRIVWKNYHEAATGSDVIHSVAYTTFCRLWRTLLPSILILKPMSDLCWQCQRNSTAILRAANHPDTEKSVILKAAENHLEKVQLERSFYKTCCDNCRKEVHRFFTVGESFSPPPLLVRASPNSKSIKVHYSFDYAQQIHFPSDPLQPGPIFFLTPRKCSIFGVQCEAFPRQVNFLTDEAVDCGKGANVVLSQLHYFFENFGLGEKEIFLTADNCCGQNKNNYMLQYLNWRCTTGLHTKITLSFLVVGHTKFSPDWCFGLLKRKFRNTKVNSLAEISAVVNESAYCNHSQLIANETAEIFVPTLDWSSFFIPNMKKVIGIKKFHHFSFDSSQPGVVAVKEHSNSLEKVMELVKTPSNFTDYPNQISPKGLSAEHQWYLYDKIRDFCSEDSRDVTCPLPSVPKPSSMQNTPELHNAIEANLDVHSPTPVERSQDNSTASLPATKRQRTCGICKEPNHNRRSCPLRNT